MKLTLVHDQLIIEGALCCNCEEDIEVHFEGKKCPFEATTFAPMLQEQFTELAFKMLNSGKFDEQFPAQRGITKVHYQTVIV